MAGGPISRAINAVARRNYPLAAADAIEWGTRRLDIAILGLFVAPYWVGIYYVAQQVAALPQKLKTSFDPILAPVITQKLAEGDKAAVARQVRQVGFWIIAAQTGIALALGMTGAAVMGLVGPQFPAGAAALAFLLAAEAVAATAVVSEAALVYIARHRNLLISLLMIVAQAAITVAIIVAMNIFEWPADPARRQAFQAAGAALGLGARARPRLGAEGAAALPSARRAGAGLALVADLGGRRRRSSSAACSTCCRTASNGFICRSARRRSCSPSASSSGGAA